MKASFIKIIAANKPGTLAAISRDLADARINIERLNAIEAGQRVIIVFAVSDPKKAVALLQKRGHHVLEERGIIVKIKDTPGALAGVAELLAKQGINLTSTNDVGRASGFAYIALTTDDAAKTWRALRGFIV